MLRSEFDELKEKLGPVDGRRVVYFNGRSASALSELMEIARIEGLDLAVAEVPPAQPEPPTGPEVLPNKADLDLLQEAAEAGIDPLPALNNQGFLAPAARKKLRDRIDAKKAETPPTKPETPKGDDDSKPEEQDATKGDESGGDSTKPEEPGE
jgi:hypothetical protein